MILSNNQNTMFKYIFFTQALSTIYVACVFYQEFVDHTNDNLYIGIRIICIALMIRVYEAVEKYDKKK